MNQDLIWFFMLFFYFIERFIYQFVNKHGLVCKHPVAYS
jgi:hypothetical protein